MSDRTFRRAARLSSAGLWLFAVLALSLSATLSACGGGGSNRGRQSILPASGNGGGGGTIVTGTAESNALEDALRIEYLKAETYLRATTGAGLAAADRGQGAGDVSGDAQVTFTSGGDIEALAGELSDDAVEHVRALRQILGSQAPPRPEMDLRQEIAALAAGAGLGQGFDAFANEDDFLMAMALLQDEAVRRYLEDIPDITDRSRQAVVLAILSEDAAHAGAARGLLAAQGTQAPGGGFAPQQ